MVAVESAENELQPGTPVLGRYTIVGKLAQGGMAEVYLAREAGSNNRFVVIKRVRPHLSRDGDFVAMFVNEARLAAMINHPNVVEIYDLGDERNAQGVQDYFLAMEYLDGRDMLQVGRACRAHNKAVPFDVTARIIADTCAGLEHAHKLKNAEGKSLDLVHRDMSPENILITFDGQVKVVDFGIAKAADNLIKTQAGQIKGKLGYVAPEAILGKAVDARADVFAIGATLYLFLSGRPAFAGTSPIEIFERSLKPPQPPREVNPRVPEALDAICMKALAQDRDKRYRSAGEVRAALESYLTSTGRPLGTSQLSTFMRILFPPDKDPVRQRIEKLIADAQQFVPAPSTQAAAARVPAPVPEPISIPDDDDNDKTNITPPTRVPQPEPPTLQTQRPNAPASTTTQRRSAPARVDITAEASAQDVDSVETSEANALDNLDVPTVSVRTGAAARDDDAVDLELRDDDARTVVGAAMPAPPPARARPGAAAPPAAVTPAAVAPASVPPPHTHADAPRDALDVAAEGLREASLPDSGPPPPFEPSSRVQRPASVVAAVSAPRSAPPSAAPRTAPYMPVVAPEVPDLPVAPEPAPLAVEPPQVDEIPAPLAPVASAPAWQPAPAPAWAPPAPAPADLAVAPWADDGPSWGKKFGMLGLGVASGMLTVILVLAFTGSLGKIFAP